MNPICLIWFVMCAGAGVVMLLLVVAAVMAAHQGLFGNAAAFLLLGSITGVIFVGSFSVINNLDNWN